MKKCLNCGLEFQSQDWVCPHCSFSPKLEDGIPIFAPEANEIDFTNENAANTEDVHNHFWFKSRARLISWVLGRWFPDASNFIDLGCGTGQILYRIQEDFPRIELSGADIFLPPLQQAKGNIPRASFFQIDLREIPFRKEFDVVGTFDVLEHVKNDIKALKEIRSSITEGGILILTVPQHKWLWSPLDNYGGHYRRYAQSELLKKVSRAGFKIVYSTSFVTLLLPIIFFSRLYLRIVENTNFKRELEIGQVLNSIFNLIMKFEFSLIKRNICFPLGSSLLLVAKK